MKLNGYQWAMVGVNIVSIIAFSIGIGWYLDNKYSSSPKFLLVFFSLSIVNVFVTMWRINAKLNKANDETK